MSDNDVRYLKALIRQSEILHELNLKQEEKQQKLISIHNRQIELLKSLEKEIVSSLNQSL